MAEALTGAQHFAPVGYGESVAAHLENLAAQQAKFGTLTGRTGVNSLRALATYVRGLEPMPGVRSESLLLGALYASQQRHSPGGQFKPGTLQARMLGNVSGGTEHPQPVAILEELVAIGIKDGADALGKAQEQVKAERDRITGQLKVVPQLEDQIASLAAELDQTRAALSEAHAELDEARDELSYWRDEAEHHGVERPDMGDDTLSAETSGGPVLLTGRKRTRHPSEASIHLRWSPKANSVEWFAYRKADGYVKAASEQDAIALRDRWAGESAPKGEPNSDMPAPTSGSARNLEEVLG